MAVLVGCLEYSPHQLPTDPDEQDLNRKAVERIVALPDAPVQFAVLGDTQRGFREAEAFVEAVNRRDDVQFVIQLGDFTHVGIWLEYREMNEIFSRLRVPYLVVVGNHDLLGNGGRIYAAMFGNTNFAFTRGRVRFVLYDDNSVAYGFDGTVPDLAWLAKQLAPTLEHDRALAFAHVPPDGALECDDALEAALIDVLAGGGVDISFHGHAHRHDVYERDGVRFVIADSVEHRSYVLVSQRPDGGFDLEKVSF